MYYSSSTKHSFPSPDAYGILKQLHPLFKAPDSRNWKWLVIENDFTEFYKAHILQGLKQKRLKAVKGTQDSGRHTLSSGC